MVQASPENKLQPVSKTIGAKKTGDMTQVVECLSSKHETLSLNPSITKKNPTTTKKNN
jgi:hypothetical protein